MNVKLRKNGRCTAALNASTRRPNGKRNAAGGNGKKGAKLCSYVYKLFAGEKERDTFGFTFVYIIPISL